MLAVHEMADAYSQILAAIGEDPSRDGLRGTPKRASEAISYLTKGYHENPLDVIGNAVFESEMDEMVIVKDIELYSMCEHHLLPFFGKCHVAYLPDGKVVGLSKIARVVDVFARRLQIQENLTRQIAQAIWDAVGAKGVGVVIEAQHLCMIMRGVEKQNSVMTTSTMLGLFRNNHSTRMEFLNLIHR